MIIGIPKEAVPGENRVALVPLIAQRLTHLGAQIYIETGLGIHLNFSNEDYVKAGTTITDRQAILKNSDIILRVQKPPQEEIALLKKGNIHISFLDPFQESTLITSLAKQYVSAMSLEMLPRTTLAQKMDALSSQASLTGYVAVILAANHINKIFPLMMTPAGTIPAARVFVIGAGVAGLQAIATAKRLGARVDAFDTRPVVEEQVKSLGAKFVKVDIGETSQTKDGYAKELTADQLAKQRQGLTKVLSQSDIVITTAQVFGRKAPVIITKEMISQMRPGSIIVDTAVESGGNVEGAQPDKTVTIGGVEIIGMVNLPSRVALDASQVYSNNLANLIETYWDKELKSLKLDLSNEIIKGCLITHQGQIVNERIKKHLMNSEGG
jgi:H+-translocating NAD(P) transhydrogenase subunit alpha